MGSTAAPYSRFPAWVRTRCSRCISRSCGKSAMAAQRSRSRSRPITTCPTMPPRGVFGGHGTQLEELAQVVEENPEKQQVAIQLGVLVADHPQLSHGSDVLQEPAPIGVVNRPGRRVDLGAWAVDVQSVLDQSAEHGALDLLPENPIESRRQLVDVPAGGGHIELRLKTVLWSESWTADTGRRGTEGVPIAGPSPSKATKSWASNSGLWPGYRPTPWRHRPVLSELQVQGRPSVPVVAALETGQQCEPGHQVAFLPAVDGGMTRSFGHCFSSD